MKRYTFNIFALVFFTIVTQAQNLPKVQQGSVKAPTNVKINGKATEWGNKFQAYNSVSRILYTLSNDQNNLYLVACMNDFYGSDKALKAGITFTINHKSNSKSKTELTFPLRAQNQNGDKISDILYFAEKSKDNKSKKDSLQIVLNNLIDASFKQIKIDGFSGIDESLMPIYNLYDIQVGIKVNDQLKYIYEFAIPLKYLQNAIDSNGKFKYNIKVNGTVERSGVSINLAKLSELMPSNTMSDSLYGAYPTDFSGEYTLLK
ncbi:hypothetical protein GCM10027049_13200 [Mucilaginibacter puniceus]